MAKETFGQRLSRLRKEKELTQNDIADKIGVTSQAVSKWENDQATPDIDVLVKLSEIFDISLDELLGKERKTVEFKEKPSKKEIEKMFLRISILGSDGEKINVNLPLSIVKVLMNRENGELNFVTGSKSLENVDFRQIIELVEQGLIGEIMSIDGSDGEKISIYVE